MSTGAPIRVVVVDDDPMVRTALRMFLGGDSGITVVGEAEDGEAGLRLVRRERPEVVLMDIRMPVRDGLSAGSVTALIAVAMVCGGAGLLVFRRRQLTF